MKNRLIAGLFMFVLFGQSTFAATFNDVNSSTSYSDAIYWTANQGITQGYENGNWGPDDCVTRAQLLKMTLMYRGNDLGTEILFNPNGNSTPFSDVKKEDWFHDFVSVGYGAGYIEGYADGTFKPNQCVARTEAMKIALEVLMPYQAKGGSSPLYYDDKVIADMEPAAWYSEYARTMFENRIVGTVHTQSVSPASDSVKRINYFPSDAMSRKEVAYMIYNVSKIYPGLACKDSGGTYTNATCSCPDDYTYNESPNYCEDAFGLPGGRLKAIFQAQHPLND